MKYVVGDIHGCYDQLEQLIHKIGFNKSRDELFLTGDLVGRGSEPAKVLDFVAKGNHQFVLGNYDIHALFSLLGWRNYSQLDNFSSFFENGKEKYYADFLLHQPFAIEEKDFILSHAGLFPGFINDLTSLNKQAMDYMKNITYEEQLKLFTHGPYYFSNSKPSNIIEQSRFIVNAFTTMRFLKCHNLDYAVNKYELSHILKNDFFTLKVNDESWVKVEDEIISPWFNHVELISKPLIFGHWARLSKIEVAPNILCIDTSCVYGGKLTAYAVEENKFISVDGKPNE